MGFGNNFLENHDYKLSAALNNVMANVKFTLEQATKSQMGNIDIALLFH